MAAKGGIPSLRWAIVNVDALTAAELLMTRGRFDEARKILVALENDSSRNKEQDNQIQFLLGLLDMQAKDYAAAVGHFHRILVHEPKSVRVRLELGRAYFLAGDYYDAEREFRFAAAGKIPPTVLANIDRFLAAIRSLKTFRTASRWRSPRIPT